MFVACKLPNGLVLTEDVKLAGAASLSFEDRTRQSGFAITDVPDGAWNSWLSRNQQSDLVARNLVAAHQDRNTLVAMLMSKKFRSAKTGFEPAGPGGKN